MTRLPGFQYDGADPDGFMPVGELVTMLDAYAARSTAPVTAGTTVRRIERRHGEFQVATDRGVWRAAAVVLATGYCDRPAIPRIARTLSDRVTQMAAADYRNPDQLPRGGVLIVGASSTGVQLADELQRAGREVVLAVGRHTRLPRRYRGRDILWWLDQLGVLTQDATAVHDVGVSRAQPSLQLVGRADHATVDLSTLRARGVRLAGHLVSVDRTRAQFADDLIATTAAADVKLATVLMKIDDFVRRRQLTVPLPDPFVATWSVTEQPLLRLHFRDERIQTVIWATGYRRDYSWLRVQVLDADGEIRHDAGVTPSAGLYVLGLNFQRRRNSSFIDGVGADARYLAGRIAVQLSARPPRVRGTIRNSLRDHRPESKRYA
jgi:putative flavoprotein involved in K+ transport